MHLHEGRVEVALELARVEGGGHDDELQVGPLRRNLYKKKRVNPTSLDKTTKNVDECICIPVYMYIYMYVCTKCI